MSGEFHMHGGGGGGKSAPPPKIHVDLTERDFVDGLKRVAFYFPLVETALEQILPDDLPYITAYLAAMVAAQDKQGALLIRSFTPAFVGYYEELLKFARSETKGGEEGGFFVIPPAEEDLKGDDEGWKEVTKLQ